MAIKQNRAAPVPELPAAAAYIARQSFYDGALGITVVAGQTVGAGHPMLAGKETLFRPFEPTHPWPVAGAAPEVESPPILTPVVTPVLTPVTEAPVARELPAESEPQP